VRQLFEEANRQCGEATLGIGLSAATFEANFLLEATLFWEVHSISEQRRRFS